MTTMNISLPDDMKAFVEEQVRAGGYMTASDYVRELLRTEKELADFRAKIDAGYASPTTELDEAFFGSLRQRLNRSG